MELKLGITNIIFETSDTKTFFLQPLDSNAIMPYKAGQFLTLILQNVPGEIRRSYSIGSTPGVDQQLFITVKRKTNGEISRHLSDHSKEGDIFTSLLPSGKFIIEEPIAETYFFIAAGSGITPVFALIKELLYYYSSIRIVLINQCRNKEHIIYKQHLQILHTKFSKRFELIHLFSQPLSQPESLQRLNNIMLETIVRKKLNIYRGEYPKAHSAHNIQFYLCGPTAMMRMAEFTLRLIGFTNDQIRKEQFVIAPPPPPPLLTDTSLKEVIIHFHKQTYHLEIAYPGNILDAALKKNIQLPYSCKGGICSTCVAYCMRGKVVMTKNEVLTEKDIDKGLVLTCVGYAATDVELRF